MRTYFIKNPDRRSTFYLENLTDDLEYIVTYYENDLRETFHAEAETLKCFQVQIISNPFQKMHFSLFRTFVHAPVHIPYKNEMVHKNNQTLLRGRNLYQITTKVKIW